LKTIFTEYAVPKKEETPIVVCKIVLVHDIEEIIELEKQIDKTVK
jgi:hypothetical protein